MKSNEVLDLLEWSGAIMNGHFKLTSGKFSPVYVDCRKIISHLKERRLLISMGCKLLKKKNKYKKNRLYCRW